MNNKKICAFIITSLFTTIHTTQAMHMLTSCFPYLFCCCSQQKNTKKNVIIQNLEVKVSNIPTLDLQPEKTTLLFFLHGVKIGYSTYNNNLFTCYSTKKEFIYLDKIFLKDEYRNRGLGKEIFKKTLENIHENFPEIEIVEWSVTPLGEFDSKNSFHKARENLFIFYTQCGAIVDQKNYKAYINLKDTGYFNRK